jgi:hypothetical protein
MRALYLGIQTASRRRITVLLDNIGKLWPGGLLLGKRR